MSLLNRIGVYIVNGAVRDYILQFTHGASDSNEPGYFQLIWSDAVSICTRILEYRVWKIEFDELDFLSISNSNFAGYTGSKNLVQTRQKFSGIPEAETFGRNRKFSAFGFRFRPPKVKAEYGRNSRKALGFFLTSVFQR